MAANNSDFFDALDLLSKEKGVSKESLIEKIKAAIVHAVRRDYGGSDNIHVDIDPEEQTFKIYIRKEVVEEVTDPNTQLSLEEGKTYRSRARVGSVIDIKNEPFTVIGLFKRSEEFQPVINSLQDYYTYNKTESGTVLLPDAIWPVVYNYDEPKMCVARAARVEDMSNVGKEVADVMAKCITGNNEELSYKAEDLLEKARNQHYGK